jgi:hypothetical protein
MSATTAPVERLFSVTGQVVTVKRRRLSPETVTLLVFLHESLPVFREIQSKRFTVVLKQVAGRRKTMNEKNVKTTLDNTGDHIQEASDDNGCDDAAEEEDDNEDKEDGEGPGMLQKE